MIDFAPSGEQKPATYKWPAIGNNQAIEFLDKTLKSGRLAQTYIFIGAAELGKSTVALALARNLQGETAGFNSDLHILEPVSGKHKISITQVREFIKNLDLSTFLNSYKIGLIKSADQLSEEAKSALLKTLEEPKPGVVIILLVESEESLPATILSRGQKVYFYSVPTTVIYDYLINNYQVGRSEAKNIAALSLGHPLRAIRYYEDRASYQAYLEKAGSVLELLFVNHHERLTIIDKIFTNKSYDSLAIKSARDLLLIISGLLRDFLLLNLGQRDLLQHLVLIDKLEEHLVAWGDEPEVRAQRLSDRLNLIGMTDTYLNNSVNPRLAIEQLVLNL